MARLATAAVVSTSAMAAVGALAFAPAAFAATGSVTYPGTQTATAKDGDTITVSGTGFTPGATIQVEECAGTAASPPPDNTSCYGLTLNTAVKADTSGNYSNTGYRAYVLGIPGFTFGSSNIKVDATAAHPGVLYVGQNANDFSQPHSFADLKIGTFPNFKLAPQTATGTAFPGGAAVSLNPATGAPTLDSTNTAQSESNYAVSAQGTYGTATCTNTGTPSCSYTVTGTPPSTAKTDTFSVTASITGANVPAGSTTNPVVETVNLGSGNPPTLAPAVTSPLGSASAGQKATIAPNAAGTDSTGAPETITGVTVAASPAPQYGTVACATTTPFDCTYTYTGGAPAGGGTDTFNLIATAVVQGSSTPTYTSAPTAAPVNIPPQYTPNCDATSGQPACPLNQIVNIPVTAGDLTMAQASGLPTDLLNHTLVGSSCTGPAIQLNGSPQYACGVISPLTVINARGTDAGWSLTGQITDFIDSGKVTATSLTPNGVSTPGTLNASCDTQVNYNNHCIPGGNMGWAPVAAVAHAIVPGDVAAVLAGTGVNAPGTVAPSTAAYPLAGNCGTYSAPNDAVTPGATGAFHTNTCLYQSTITFNTPGSEPAAPAGLHNIAQTLCSSSQAATTTGGQAMGPGHAGGTFLCGASVVVAVPASAAVPTAAGVNGQTGYQAFLTLTLA